MGNVMRFEIDLSGITREQKKSIFKHIFTRRMPAWYLKDMLRRHNISGRTEFYKYFSGRAMRNMIQVVKADNPDMNYFTRTAEADKRLNEIRDKELEKVVDKIELDEVLVMKHRSLNWIENVFQCSRIKDIHFHGIINPSLSQKDLLHPRPGNEDLSDI